MNRRQFTTIASAVSLAVLIAACGKEAPPRRPRKADVHVPLVAMALDIGSAERLPGPQADIGIDGRNGVQLAVEDANKANVQVGGKPVKFEMVAEDDEANATKATTVA